MKTLSYGLAYEVAKQLREKYAIDHWATSSITAFDNFTEEELSKITELSLDNNTGLKGHCRGIEFLPNLRKLSIISKQNYAYTSQDDISSITQSDIQCIQKCVALEELRIQNQQNALYLNLSGLPNLKKIDISDNNNLKKIYGLDKLPKLKSLTCVGNETLEKVENLDSVIANGQFDYINLDVMLFPSSIGYEPMTGNFNQRAIDTLERTRYQSYYSTTSDPHGVIWSQSVTRSYIEKGLFSSANQKLQIIHRIQMTHHEMIQLHNKACQILDEILRPTVSDKDCIVAIENYLAKNVTYDALREEEKQGHAYGANGAFNCLVKNNCVCEGYSRGEQYLLALRGIRSRPVHCIGGHPDKIGMADSKKNLDRFTLDQEMPNLGDLHSILCITDMYHLYSDPCWNACVYQKKGDKSLPYCLLTKSEISKIHTPSFFEKNISNEHLHINRDYIAESLKLNNLFCEIRMQEVERQRRLLKPPRTVRGIISTGRN